MEIFDTKNYLRISVRPVSDFAKKAMILKTGEKSDFTIVDVGEKGHAKMLVGKFKPSGSTHLKTLLLNKKDWKMKDGKPVPISKRGEYEKRIFTKSKSKGGHGVKFSDGGAYEFVGWIYDEAADIISGKPIHKPLVQPVTPQLQPVAPQEYTAQSIVAEPTAEEKLFSKMERYTKNLNVEDDKVYSYGTHVATIKGDKLLVHGHWSKTTSKHINYVAKELGLTKVDAPKLKTDEGSDSALKTTVMVAKMGELFGKTHKEKNDWKVRMLKAGLGGRGLIMPEDWDTLSEDEKEKRLNNALGVLDEPKKKVFLSRHSKRTKSRTGEGKGWHREPVRHSIASKKGWRKK